ncbi:MAG: HAMP domain-containing histidine kinase [Chloroflexaceae bacterium]|nr:HAMP domain-containing histidine kinase [Chloroflexaceae bacterium]
MELLQALTHEIRTPLTTIRTLVRSLLKRSQLAESVLKRLEAIDQECTEQINRMELIFRAAELETQATPSTPTGLTSIALENLLHQSIPYWQKQAQRRNVQFDLVLPSKLPTVVGNSHLLHQVLAGLMEKCIRSLPNGGQIRLEVATAGSQLKLEFRTQRERADRPLKALGNLLMFQPETGNLSLNWEVTKNLFQAMGGKLIVRQRLLQGEILTVFLPLDSADAEAQAFPLTQ